MMGWMGCGMGVPFAYGGFKEWGDGWVAEWVDGWVLQSIGWVTNNIF